MHFTTLQSKYLVHVIFLAQHTWLFQELKTSDNEVRLIATFVMIKIFNMKNPTKFSNKQTTPPSQNKTVEGLFIMENNQFARQMYI